MKSSSEIIREGVNVTRAAVLAGAASYAVYL